EMANALGDAFQEIMRELNTANARDTVAQINKQLSDSEKQLATSRKALDQYRIQHQIPGASATQMLETAQFRVRDFKFKLEDHKQKLAKAEAQLAEKQAEFNGIPETVRVVTPPQQNPNLPNLDNEIAIGQRALAALKNRYADSHPAVKQAQEALD